MTPFVMRINQQDYSFLMKCLNWAITHDDGVETVLYDIPNKQTQLKEDDQPPQKDPFYLKLTIDCLSLFLMKKGVPIAFLILDDLKYNFRQKDEMYMDFVL
jgi:DNA-directed RNA polymerase subunit L